MRKWVVLKSIHYLRQAWTQLQNRQVEGCTLLPWGAAPLPSETQQFKSLLPSLQHCRKYQTPLAIIPPFSATTLFGFLQYLPPNFIYRLISSSSNFTFFFFMLKYNLQAGNNQNSVHAVYNCSLSKHSARKGIKKYFINFCHLQ